MARRIFRDPHQLARFPVIEEIWLSIMPVPRLERRALWDSRPEQQESTRRSQSRNRVELLRRLAHRDGRGCNIVSQPLF